MLQGVSKILNSHKSIQCFEKVGNESYNTLCVSLYFSHCEIKAVFCFVCGFALFLVGLFFVFNMIYFI